MPWSDSVLLLSGGVDSLVLLARERAEGRRPLCVSFDYGQRHRLELQSAKVIAGYFCADWKLVVLPPECLAGSALTGSAVVPKGLHFADPGQAVTVVPNRNMIFLSLAAGLAAERVLFAAHAGDAPVYPDCRPEFVRAADACLRLGCGVGVEAPFLGMSKRQIVALGRALDAPFRLSWSCYDPRGKEPCGACGACMERKEAFNALED